MAKPTGELLTKLRSAMKNKAFVRDILQAYIIPSEDAHQVIMDSVSSWQFIDSWSFLQKLYIITLQYVHCDPHNQGKKMRNKRN